MQQHIVMSHLLILVEDTYLYNKGDGITAADIRNVHLGSLAVDLGNGDIIHINNEAQANAIFANQANDARYECERKVA